MGLFKSMELKSQRLRKTHIQLSDRAILLSLRWLVFLGLFTLALYNRFEANSLREGLRPIGIVVLYGISNIVLTLWFAREGIPRKAAALIFIIDSALVGASLYYSIGADFDLYLICFLIVYLSTLGRRVRDALPLAVVTGLIYIALLLHQHGNFSFIDPHILLRFPFFFILAFFTTYLTEETEKGRVKIRELETAQRALQKERDGVALQLDQKQAQLVQAEKLSAMGHMAGALAHEIRNPLCVILGYAGELQVLLGKDHPQFKLFATIERCANRCNQLVENLLRFARLPKDEERFSLNEAIQEAVELARIGKKAINVRCQMDFQCDAWIRGKRTEIQQVVLNLSANAMDAMPSGGTLTVRTRQEAVVSGEWYVIEVEDTGTGIPEDVRKNIFDPFFTTKPAGKGTGLGLCIVGDILRSCGGTIDVVSEVGKGTSFLVRLPVAIPVPVVSVAA